MRPYALLYLYRRRLRVHGAQELLAGLGVAIAVALVFSTIVASGSIAGSAGEVVHAVTGPATLQVRTRGGDGFEEGMLKRVEALPAVKQAAPLLEQTATLTGPHGQNVTVNLAGADTSLVVLNGLAHTIPIATLQPGGVGLSSTTASELGIAGSPVRPSEAPEVGLRLRGRSYHIKVSAVLGPEAVHALSQARIAVMPLARLQRFAGLPGRISRILVLARPGREAAARAQLRSLAAGRLTVAPSDQDVSALHQALRPSDQASGFFAAISGLLGLLFAFNALILTVPERRRAIADLRLIGTRRSAIVQMTLFQALALGIVASLVGLAGGYALSLSVFHQSPRYLAEAFTLGSRTVVGPAPVLLAFLGGVLATTLASTVPLLDLRRGGALDAVYQGDGVPGNTLSRRAQVGLGVAAMSLLAATTVLFIATPSHALLACSLLALATVLTVPLAFAGVVRGAHGVAERWQTLTILPVALSSLRSTTVRSLALAATGAVALFGAVALGGGRSDLLHGIQGFARSYASDAPIWVSNPDDNQATVDFLPEGLAGRLAHVPGVAGVQSFQGGFMQMGARRVWVIARPPGAERHVLESQLEAGAAGLAMTRLAEGGWIAVSKQLADEHHVGVGDTLSVPTPSGSVPMRIAATTTNLAWSPGVIFMGTGDYSRLWGTNAPTALGVSPAPGAPVASVQRAIQQALGPASGLAVYTAQQREARINALTSEGLSQLGQISLLLLIAAILTMATALTSAIWQRRASLAALRLAGVRSHRLRMILLVEAALMLGAGCVAGALAGIYGQVVIDGYLQHVTGFPVASLGTALRPLEIFALVIVVVLAMVSVPGWIASRVSPTLAFSE